MEGRCETCRFWREPQFDFPSCDPRLSFVNGEWVPHSNGRYMDWRSCALINHETSAEPNIEVIPDAYCEGNTEVFTAPDFGCVHWEPDAADAGTD
jgi:hypothetical protein